MKIISISFRVVVAAVALSATFAQGATAEALFGRGKTLLKQGDFQGALRKFTDAVRADRGNKEYARNYTMVRRIISLRNRLDLEQEPNRWEYVALALHAFYTSERIYPESLALGEKMHARLNNASTARMLAETQLAMGRNADAVDMLASLSSDKRTPATQALYGIALLRQGDIAEARQIANSIVAPGDAGPRMRYCLARLKAAVGNSAEALGLLEGCFQNVPPSLLADYKSHARQCEEFEKLIGTSGFDKVLKTKSKVAESKCSGGGNCAGCPNRENCKKSRM